MGRRIAVAAVIALAGSAAWTIRPQTVTRPSVIGDGAPDIAAALAERTVPAHEVAVLRRWQSLDHMADLRRLCRDACDGTAPVVALRQPTWDGLRRVLIVDVGALGGGAALDGGHPLPPTVLDRVVAVIEGGGPRRVAWRLPFGL